MWLINVPNFLTLFRISLIPIFMVVFYWPNELSYPVATIIFALAAVTDWLDGFLARKLEQVSPIGEFLDPVADKLIVVVALVLLVESYTSVLISVSTAIIVCREIMVSALREWMAEIGSRAKVAVSWLGKVKTFTQMFAILLLLSQPAMSFRLAMLENKIIFIGYLALLFSVLLALWSMCQYSYLAWQDVETSKLQK